MIGGVVLLFALLIQEVKNNVVLENMKMNTQGLVYNNAVKYKIRYKCTATNCWNQNMQPKFHTIVKIQWELRFPNFIRKALHISCTHSATICYKQERIQRQCLTFHICGFHFFSDSQFTNPLPSPPLPLHSLFLFCLPYSH